MNIKYLNVLTFLLLCLLNGEFLAAQGDCENLPTDCLVEAIDLGTGVNVAGGRDQAWQIIEEPNGNMQAFAPFLAVSPPGAWDQVAGGQWIAPTNVATALEARSNVGDPDPYVYQRCFCTCAGGVLSYDLQIFADNFINQVRLGGQVLYTRGTGVGNTTHFINGIQLQGSLNLGAGTHCLEVDVDNTDFIFPPNQTLGASSTGLKVIGVVSGGNLVQDGCCELIADAECCDEGEGTVFREDFTNGFVSTNTDYLAYNGQQLNPGEYGFINSGQASTLSNNQWDVVDPTNCDPNTSFLAINGRTGGTGFAVAYETDLFSLEPGDIYDVCVELKHLPQCLFDQVPQVRIAIFEYRAIGPGTPVFWSPVTSLQTGVGNCDYQTLTATFTGPNTALIRDYALRIYVDERPQGDGNDFAVDNININQRLPTDPALALFYTDDLRAQANEIHCTPVSPLPDNCSAFWEVWEAPSRDDPQTRIPGTYMWGNDNVNGWNTNSQTLFPAYGGSSPAGSFLEDHVYVIQRTVRCPCELTAVARDIRDSGFNPLLPPDDGYLAKSMRHPQTVNVYPNPASSTFNLLFGQPTQAIEVAQLYAPSGKLLREIPIAAGIKQLEVEVDELPAGMYYIRIQLNGEEFHQKLIKQ